MKTMGSFDMGSIIELLLFVAALVGVYVKLQVKMKELEIRLKQVETQDQKIMDKLEEINEKLMEIQIDLHNKQNR